jgi:L-rhamnose-H+ transport protein
LVATFSGIMSACFSFALTWGKPISEASVAAGTAMLWTGLPKLCVVLAGGFTTNFIWCVLLNIRNRTGYQYFSSEIRRTPTREQETIIETAIDAPCEEVVEHSGPKKNAVDRAPMLANYCFSALAGTCWYFQFFFYTMGETQMGKFSFASWTLHMASIIIFSTMWGWILHEWKGSSRKAHGLIAAGIATLILSTIIIGFGTYLKGLGGQ